MILSQTKKEDFKPDSLKIIKKRRFVNSLVLLLYMDILLIFFFLTVGFLNC